MCVCVYIYVYIYIHAGDYNLEAVLSSLEPREAIDRQNMLFDLVTFKVQLLICLAESLTTKFPRSAHTAYFCDLYGSQNKHRLFPYTTLSS